VRGNLLRLLGALQLQRGDPSGALTSYFAAHKIFQQLGDVRSQSVMKQWIASLYDNANDFDRAEKYFREAAELPLDDPAMALSIHNNLGAVLIQSERYAAADLEYRRALALARQLKSAPLEARILANMAWGKVEDGKYDEAERSVAEGFRVSATPEARSMLPQFEAIGARIAYFRKDYDKAARLIGAAFAGVDTTETGSDFRDAHQVAYAIYVARGDSRRALAHLEALKRLSDQATKAATTNSTQLMAAKFDSANQQAQIATLKAADADRRAHFQLVLFLSIGAAVAVIMALLGVGVITLRRSRNQVRAANADLAQSNVALEKALRAKTEFLATTSHEIRTPLNGILGMTQVMLADPTLPAGARDRIGVVHGAGVTMRALVDDILDVAKIETGNLTVELAPMDLRATLKDVTRMWEEQARSKGLRFTLDLAEAPGWIVSDAGRLRQVVFNLLSNAIKFTAEGGVTVRASASEAQANEEATLRRLRIAITDTGIGIPEDKRELIFESFKQVDASTTRRFGGTGLGLTICRNLARALGGDVQVDSKPHFGSTFTIDLPLVTAATPEQSAPLERSVLLLVERNPIARSMLRSLLEQRGVRVVFATTFAEAEAAFAENRFEQLLVDEGAARADAGEPFVALAELMAAARGAGTRVALLWSQTEVPQRAQIEALDADLLLEKPIAGALLVERLFPGSAENHGGEAKRPLVSHVA
jgi:signal transduction histidine kinase/Tfp pilus assembly protein PilF